MKTVSAIAVIAMVLVAFLVAPVAAANADNDLYTSKYAPVDPGYPTTGSLSGAVRCHNNLLTTGVTITDPNGVTTTVDLRADGTFDLNGLAPGEYVMNIADGNGGQPESAKFTIRAGYTSFLESELLGHAVGPADEPAQLDTIVVLNATYGMQRVVIDSPAVPAVPGTPAVTHQDYAAGHVHAKQVGGNSQHDFIYNGHKYQIVGNQAEAAFMVQSFMGHIYDAHPAQQITIVDTPAISGTPAIPAVTHIEGSYADVRADVQAVIDGGAREFLFDNSKQGIMSADGSTVLKTIADPAYGQVKSVEINVEINGVLKTINKMEREIITI